MYIYIYIYSYIYLCSDTNQLFTKISNWPILFPPSYPSYSMASRQYSAARLQHHSLFESEVEQDGESGCA